MHDCRTLRRLEHDRAVLLLHVDLRCSRREFRVERPRHVFAKRSALCGAYPEPEIADSTDAYQSVRRRAQLDTIPRLLNRRHITDRLPFRLRGDSDEQNTKSSEHSAKVHIACVSCQCTQRFLRMESTARSIVSGEAAKHMRRYPSFANTMPGTEDTRARSNSACEAIRLSLSMCCALGKA